MLAPELLEAALLMYALKQWGEPSIGEFTNYRSHVPGTTFDVPGLGIVTLVDFHDYDQDKSYDGWSEDIWMVFEYQGTYYRKTGKHTSYTGTDWNHGMKIVHPVEKTVIIYEEN